MAKILEQRPHYKHQNGVATVYEIDTNLKLLIQRNFIPTESANGLLGYLATSDDWEQPDKIYNGKTYPEPYLYQKITKSKLGSLGKQMYDTSMLTSTLSKKQVSGLELFYLKEGGNQVKWMPIGRTLAGLMLVGEGRTLGLRHSSDYYLKYEIEFNNGDLFMLAGGNIKNWEINLSKRQTTNETCLIICN